VSTRTLPPVVELRAAAGAVADPEIPILTLDDLGIVRNVRVVEDGTVEVIITPTYTGCPATAVIADDVRAAVEAAGAPRVVVRMVLSPAWTTDWMSEEGRTKLREFGIAPPGPVMRPEPFDKLRTAPVEGRASTSSARILLTLTVRCPHCGSADTREVSRFGSTPCKALWVCRTCAEPFDSFKSI
jgi:ring-1,2-phenylacetyl-CoA epoxidase subunit PaaD